MPPPEPSDDALMQALAGGRVDAFEVLYARHHRAVFRFLLRSLGHRQTAEDLLQETFLRLFAQCARYRPTATFRPWLFTIARNLVIDHVRQRATRPDPGQTELSAERPDAASGPLEHAEGRALEERLQAAILRLPPSQQEVLLLSRIAGLSHEEVARITGASAVAVRVTLHRALTRLRQLLGSTSLP